jgi:hypothetical protein
MEMRYKCLGGIKPHQWSFCLFLLKCFQFDSVNYSVNLLVHVTARNIKSSHMTVASLSMYLLVVYPHFRRSLGLCLFCCLVLCKQETFRTLRPELNWSSFYSHLWPHENLSSQNINSEVKTVLTHSLKSTSTNHFIQ